MQKTTIEPFNMIGLAIKTTNEGQQALQYIAELWQRFLGENMLAKIPNKVDDTIYSLYTNYEGNHTQPYTTLLGCRTHHLDEIPDGLVGMAFKGGTYVKTTAKGDLTKGLVGQHWGKIWAMDLERVYTADFEVFGTKAQNPNDAEVDFYVAVKA